MERRRRGSRPKRTVPSVQKTGSSWLCPFQIQHDPSGAARFVDAEVFPYVLASQSDYRCRPCRPHRAQFLEVVVGFQWIREQLLRLYVIVQIMYEDFEACALTTLAACRPSLARNWAPPSTESRCPVRIRSTAAPPTRASRRQAPEARGGLPRPYSEYMVPRRKKIEARGR